MKEKKKSTKDLVIELRKNAREKKEKIWLDLAKRLSKPTRTLARVNIEGIARIAGKQKGKILVVPGKVLSKGELTETVEVAAFAFSEKAGEKINAKGKAYSLPELMESGKKARDMLIVK